jgi:dihydropyrimidinase
MAAEYDILVLNGVVVTDQEVKEADIAIKGEKIAALKERGGFKDAKAIKVIDAGGAYITPGGVDAHVHLQEPALFGKGSSADTFETGECLIMVCLMPRI